MAGVCAFGLLVLNGCGPGSGAPSLNIVSPHSHEIQNAFADLWKKSHPETEIKWIDQGGTSDDLKFVRDQFATSGKDKGIGIDLFFGGGGETFTELESDDLLVPLAETYGVPAQLNGVPLRGKNDDWVAAALSGFGILYNKKIAARDALPVPQTWADLANPKLQERVELADPRHSGSAHTTYEIILQTNGWDKGWKILTAMTGNCRKFALTGSEPQQDVQNGEAVFCSAIDFYATGAIARGGQRQTGLHRTQRPEHPDRRPDRAVAGRAQRRQSPRIYQIGDVARRSKIVVRAAGHARRPGQRHALSFAPRSRRPTKIFPKARGRKPTLTPPKSPPTTTPIKLPAAAAPSMI